MPTERLSMRKTKEILRLKWQHQRSHREIARAFAVGVGTLSLIHSRGRITRGGYDGNDGSEARPRDACAATVHR